MGFLDEAEYLEKAVGVSISRTSEMDLGVLTKNLWDEDVALPRCQ